MQRFLPVFVLIVLIPLPGWSSPQYDLPYLTDTGTIPIPTSSNPGTLVLPDTLPDFFDNLWIAAYNEAKSLGIAEDTAQLKAYWAWQEFNVDPAVLEMTKPMLEAIKQGKQHKSVKALKQVVLQESPNPEFPLQPTVLYDGSNMDALFTDINEHRGIFVNSRLRPEMILKLYQVPEYTSDYRILFRWIEAHLYKSAIFLANKANWFDV